MDVRRTPDARFADLPDYPFEPNYVDLDGVRMHYVDEGPRDGRPVLMLHGEPSWSFLYRHMIPVLSAAGLRAVAPDLIGFGKSDKPSAQSDYTYDRHEAWVQAFVEHLELDGITLFCQDWGGLIGLRLIVGALADRFDRAVAANTFLPSGREPMPDAFLEWQRFSRETDVFEIGRIIQNATEAVLSPEVVAGYDAPFPDDTFKAGARIFPSLVPTDPDSDDARTNQAAWGRLFAYAKPFLTAFSDKDPITRGADRFLQTAIPGAKGQPHTTIEGAGHFLQEERGPELAQLVIDFVEATS